MSGTLEGAFDPERHENQVVAVFEDRALADAALRELLNAGVPASAIRIIDQSAAAAPDAPARAPGGLWMAITGLFAPPQDLQDYDQAIERGHAMVVVTPDSVSERETAIEVLEGHGPIDVEGRRLAASPAGDPAPTVHSTTLNHAMYSRADMHGHEVPGHAQPMLDMVGQPMTVRVVSDVDAGSGAEPGQLPPKTMPISAPPQIPAGEPAPNSASGAPRVTYTFGVPEELARSMTVEQQIEAQAPATAEAVIAGNADARKSVRIVEERMRVGWREQHARAVRVRSYVATKPAGGQRVELLEEEISHPTARPEQ